MLNKLLRARKANGGEDTAVSNQQQQQPSNTTRSKPMPVRSQSTVPSIAEMSTITRTTSSTVKGTEPIVIDSNLKKSRSFGGAYKRNNHNTTTTPDEIIGRALDCSEVPQDKKSTKSKLRGILKNRFAFKKVAACLPAVGFFDNHDGFTLSDDELDDDERVTTPSIVPTLDFSAVSAQPLSSSVDYKYMENSSFSSSPNFSGLTSANGSPGSLKMFSPRRSTSVVRLQAINKLIQNTPRARKDSWESPLSSRKRTDSSAYIPSPTKSGHMTKRRPSSFTMSIGSPPKSFNSGNEFMAAFELQLKDEIESSCHTVAALNERFYSFCEDGNFLAAKYMIMQRVFTCQRKTNTGRRFALNLQTKFGSDQESVLHVAARNNHDQIVELLLANGICVDEKDKSLRTPLHMAASKGSHNATIVLLANHAQITATDVFGFSPLHLCIRGHHFDLANDMFLFNADINFKGSKGSSVLHDCMSRGDLQALQFLLNLPAQYRVLVNHKDDRSETPLMKAVVGGHVKCVEYLLGKRSDIAVSAITDRGQNVFHMCAQCTGENQKEMLDKLIQLVMKYPSYDKSKLLQLLNERDKTRGQTPLHLAVIYKNMAMIEGIHQVITTLGIDINVADKNGNTPTHIAISKYNNAKNADEASEYQAIVKALISFGSALDWSVTNKDNVTVQQLYKSMHNSHVCSE